MGAGKRVVDELTIVRANIEDGVRGVDIILEEVPTEDLPDAVFSRFVFRTEPRRVAHGVRVTLSARSVKLFLLHVSDVSETGTARSGR